MKINSAEFIISNSVVSKCPQEPLPEYAFIGRSNVGKSSLINMLTNHKNLAKTSGRPGKTQLINHFKINQNWFLVDLPGYGYARVSKSTKATFQKFITDYFKDVKDLAKGRFDEGDISQLEKAVADAPVQPIANMEAKEKVGNMDADAFDAAMARLKKLAGAGPMKTVWDPARRVYKNVPTAVQPKK